MLIGPTVNPIFYAGRLAVLSKLRARLTYANVMATIAVFIALGGSSYAAITVTGKNVKNSSLTGKDVKNNSLTGSDVKSIKTGDVTDRSLLAKDFKAGQLPSGAQGLKGDPGPFPDPLQSGKTLRGTYAAGDRGAASEERKAYDSIDFGFTLPSEPSVNVRLLSAAPNANCPGTVTNPQAASGQLCVYESVGSVSVFNPATDDPNSSMKQGAAISVAGTADTIAAFGTWAVTAP